MPRLLSPPHPSRTASWLLLTRDHQASPSSELLHLLFPLLGVLFPGLNLLPERPSLPTCMTLSISSIFFLATVTSPDIIQWLAQWLLLVLRARK